jgi:hypothetical protein
MDSVSAICKGANQVMVYGGGHCQYKEVTDCLDDQAYLYGSRIQKVFSCLVAGSLRVYHTTTLEGRNMNIIKYVQDLSHPKVIARACKAALTDLVLENYKRIKEGEEIIPMLFCIDIDGNPKPYTAESICSREQAHNQQITHTELRRAYKLCTHKNPAIRRAALATFKFVKLEHQGGRTYALKQIPAPWESSKFAKNWKKREKSSSSKPKPDSVNWRKQLESCVEAYDRETLPKRDPSHIGKATATMSAVFMQMAASSLPSGFLSIIPPVGTEGL